MKWQTQKGRSFWVPWRARPALSSLRPMTPLRMSKLKFKTRRASFQANSTCFWGHVWRKTPLCQTVISRNSPPCTWCFACRVESMNLFCQLPWNTMAIRLYDPNVMLACNPVLSTALKKKCEYTNKLWLKEMLKRGRKPSSFEQVLQRKKPSELILWEQHYCDANNRERHYKKRKLQNSIRYEPWCKNLQLIIADRNQKDYPPCTSEIYSQNARVSQHMKIHLCNLPYQHKWR